MRTFVYMQLSTPLRCMRLKSYVLVDSLIHPSFVVACISLFLFFIKHVFSILDVSVFPVTFRPTFTFQSKADVTMSVIYCVLCVVLGTVATEFHDYNSSGCEGRDFFAQYFSKLGRVQ